MKRVVLLLVLMVGVLPCEARFTRQDTLRGSNGPGRDWWDVLKYKVDFEIDTANKTISGTNTITFRIVGQPREMQIDLQEGMEMQVGLQEQTHPIVLGEVYHPLTRQGNAYWLWDVSKIGKLGDTVSIVLRFYGHPHVARNPPWDGGFIWARDSLGNPWIAVACQGLGASSWWPCKDYQGDEPDSGMQIRVKIVRPNIASADDEGPSIVLNGRSYGTVMSLPGLGAFIDKSGKRQKERLLPYDQELHADGFVKNPINTYNTTFYVGDYAHYHDTLHGEKGILDLDFHPLRYNLKKAKKQWAVTKDMLRCFEYWMGPYPFYEDGYKLVEAPYLGMEHQSAIAYGNGYKMGYRGMDISGTGLGLEFDYIIIHESGHEWFGNNITARDRADNWIHEGFTSYTEALYVEWIKGKEAAFRYTTGNWQRISNDEPVIAPYGVNAQGTGDQYYKAAAVVHMVRMMLNDDAKFRQLLRGLNKDFYHKIVTSKEVEDYISRFVGKDLKAFFDVYLRHTQLPVVLAKQHGDRVTLTLRSERDLKLPVFYKGRAVCELSSVPVSIPISELKGLLNYLIVYIPADNGTLPLLRD